jgi:hypothetical protein
MQSLDFFHRLDQEGLYRGLLFFKVLSHPELKIKFEDRIDYENWTEEDACQDVVPLKMQL